MLKTLAGMVKKLEKYKVFFVRADAGRRNTTTLSAANAKSFRHMLCRTRKAASHKVRRTRAQY